VTLVAGVTSGTQIWGAGSAGGVRADGRGACQAAAGPGWRVAVGDGVLVGTGAAAVAAGVSEPPSKRGVMVGDGVATVTAKVGLGGAGVSVAGGGCSSPLSGVGGRGRVGVAGGTVCPGGPCCGAAQAIGPALTASPPNAAVSRHKTSMVRHTSATAQPITHAYLLIGVL